MKKEQLTADCISKFFFPLLLNCFLFIRIHHLEFTLEEKRLDEVAVALSSQIFGPRIHADVLYTSAKVKPHLLSSPTPSLKELHIHSILF